MAVSVVRRVRRDGGLGGRRCTVLPTPLGARGPRNPRTVKGQNDHHEFLTKVMLEPVVGASPKPEDCRCSLSLAVERVFHWLGPPRLTHPTPPHPPQRRKAEASRGQPQAACQVGTRPFRPKTPFQAPGSLLFPVAEPPPQPPWFTNGGVDLPDGSFGYY